MVWFYMVKYVVKLRIKSKFIFIHYITPGETQIETGKTNQIHSRDPIHSINNADEGKTHTRPLIRDVPFHPGLTYRPPPKPIRSNMPRSQESSQGSNCTENINPDINLDFEENSQFQEGIISKAEDQTSHSFKNPKNCMIL